MNLSNARATFGLQAKATPTSSNISGTVQIGANNETASFPNADVAYSLRAIFAGTADNLVIDLTDCDTTGSTAFVAGTAQVETATITAASGATSSGTMTMVLASAGMTGSPLNVPVALVTGTHTTAALIASAARAALSANAVVAARFSIGGTGANIVLTRKPTSTHSVPTGTLNLYAANDTTLNLAIPAGLGVTLAATSANTTAGVVSDGVKIYDGDGKDFEGDALATISAFYGLLATGTGSISYASSTSVYKGGVGNGSMFLQSIGDMPLTFTSSHSEAAELTITVIGASA
jgi:hypothetical protein